MSKYLNIGMPLEEVLYRTTARPAEIIGHSELGKLEVGMDADISVLRVKEGNFGFADSGNARMQGKQMLECKLTIRAGEICNIIQWLMECRIGSRLRNLTGLLRE